MSGFINGLETDEDLSQYVASLKTHIGVYQRRAAEYNNAMVAKLEAADDLSRATAIALPLLGEQTFSVLLEKIGELNNVAPEKLMIDLANKEEVITSDDIRQALWGGV